MNGYECTLVMQTVGKYESIGGDIKLSMLKNCKNLSALVCDGGIRDIETVKTYNIPIYASSVTCKQGPATQIPWTCNDVIAVGGDIACAPFDYVIGDEHNVIIVPQNNVDTIICIAEIRETVEECIKMEIGNNTQRIPDFYPFATP